MPKTEKRKVKNKTSAERKRQYSKLKADFLTFFRQLPIQKLAAGFIGKDEDTITNWKKKDKKFADQIGTAKSEWALDNVGKVKSTEWLLERIMNEHFGEKREVEHSFSAELQQALDRMAQILPK